MRKDRHRIARWRDTSTQDVGRNLLSQCIHGRLRMPRWKERKGTSVHDTKVLRSIDPRLAIQYGHAVVGTAHFASCGGVVDGHKASLNVGENIGVRGHVEAGQVFGGADSDVGDNRPDFARALEALDGEFLVGWIREPIRINDWRVGNVSAGYSDVAAGERGDEARVDGGVVVAVAGIFCLSICLVAKVSTDG